LRRSKNAQQENKGTSTSQEQKQEQHLPIRHAGRPADFCTISGSDFTGSGAHWLCRMLELRLG